MNDLPWMHFADNNPALFWMIAIPLFVLSWYALGAIVGRLNR